MRPKSETKTVRMERKNSEDLKQEEKGRDRAGNEVKGRGRNKKCGGM